MRQKSTESVAASSPTWETSEAFARQGMQRFLQQMLEEEVDGLLARGRYERAPPSMRRSAIATGSGSGGG